MNIELRTARLKQGRGASWVMKRFDEYQSEGKPTIAIIDRVGASVENLNRRKHDLVFVLDPDLEGCDPEALHIALNLWCRGKGWPRVTTLDTLEKIIAQIRMELGEHPGTAEGLATVNRVEEFKKQKGERREKKTTFAPYLTRAMKARGISCDELRCALIAVLYLAMGIKPEPKTANEFVKFSQALV